jgi:hypothetical protein
VYFGVHFLDSEQSSVTLAAQQKVLVMRFFSHYLDAGSQIVQNPSP